MSEYEHLTKITNILHIFEIAFIVFAGIALILAIVFFIKYKIPKVISEISGKQKQKQLEKMQADKSMANTDDYHIGFSDSSGNNGSETSKKSHGTVSKDSGSAKKRRETGLAKNERKTALMDKRSTAENQRKTHQTVALNRSKEQIPDLIVIDEILIIASDEVIE